MSDHENDPLLAEAIARRDESRAEILRSKAQASNAGIDAMAKAFAKLADQATEDAKQSAAALGNIDPVKPDMEGTSRLLSDSEGNFAATAEVAAVGGIGIDGSNSTASGAPAQTAEDAGTATTPGAQKIIGDQPVGTATTSRSAETSESRAAVEVPADWQTLSWQERRSLASQLSDEPITNGEQANAAIEAELKRRG